MYLNINDKATVILTDFGKTIVDNHKKDIEEKTRLKIENILSYDENGKYTTELWYLMFIFGKYMTMSQKQVFVNSKIYFEKW